MNTISADHLLNQIRTMGRDLQPIQPMSMPLETGKSEFGSLLKTSIDAVNDAQKTAGALKLEFETGNTEKSLAEVMIAGQKADLSFRAATEVRNKLVSAYQDIMNMPV
jgi:flagellar hook-basal body complex protein FliE